MKGCLIAAVPIITGVGLLVLGFAYDVFFAGIPLQDPTPALRAQYASDAAVARGLELSGLVVLCCGLILGVVRRFRNSSRTASKPG